MDEITGKFITTSQLKETHDIRFIQKNCEIIKLCVNGDIYVKGKLVENDIEVVEGMRELLGLENN